MPYIRQETRRVAQHVVSQIDVPGDLNYHITYAIDTFLYLHGVNYGNLNAAIGVLECAKLELYRRVAAPYEDKKRSENGDVYTCLEAK